MSLEDGVVDITETVEELRQAWVTWSIRYINGLEAATPELMWLNGSLTNSVEEAILKVILDAISKAVEMQAFFLNTAIRKASQAKDFTKVVREIREKQENMTEEEFEKAEQRKMDAFRNFVSVTA